MNFNEIALNLLLGIVSGSVSGYLISLYFKNKDEQTKWKSDLDEDKQTMSRFIDMVCLDFEQLMDSSNRENNDLLKLLKSPPRFKSFKDLNKIKPEHQTFTRDAYELFDEIYYYLKEEVPEEPYEIPQLDYVKFRARLRKVQFNILMINRNEIERSDSLNSRLTEP